MVTLDQIEAKAHDSLFLRDLLSAVTQGRRDFITGFDQVVSEYIDPRVSGSVGGDFILARCLSSAWRCPENEPLSSITLLMAGPDSIPVVLPLEAWEAFSGIDCFGDGTSAQLASGSVARRFTIRSGVEVLEALCPQSERGQGEDGRVIRGTQPKVKRTDVFGQITVRVGTIQDRLIAEYVNRAGINADPDGAYILAFWAPIATGDAVDGGVSNAWRPSHVPHLDGSHITSVLARQIHSVPTTDPWTDDPYREELFSELAAVKGSEPTKREFLNALAGASPLRTVFPLWLTRFFPEVEAVFWCAGDPLWDNSSPAERFLLLKDLKPSGSQIHSTDAEKGNLGLEEIFSSLV